MQAPLVDIDLRAFWQDPYPALAQMRRDTPICFVPQLGATLLTRRDDIFQCEKMIEVFSSLQPGGLMTTLMGENMMRKDGAEHTLERQQSLPALSPVTVKQIWKTQFEQATSSVLDSLAGQSSCDLVCDYAMPVSGHALRHITGLTNMTPEQLDRCSQGMMDGIANYSADPAVEKRCMDSTQFIDDCIDEMLLPGADLSAASLLNVLMQAAQPIESVRANVKLAISGGQNEPRDAIAGAVWAVLSHPQQAGAVINGDFSWQQVLQSTRGGYHPLVCRHGE